MGDAILLEVYLFVNPIGEHCLAAENSVLELVSARSEKIHYQFLPLVNLNTIKDIMLHQNLDSHNLQLRNQVFQTIYQASLDYKAALFQGKRRGQNFLISLQSALNFDHYSYSTDLIKQLAETNKLDVDMFLEDRQSALAKESFESDQHVACEMNIQTHPSTVIFNYDNPEQDYGILIEDCQSFELLNQVCDGNLAGVTALGQPSFPDKSHKLHTL